MLYQKNRQKVAEYWLRLLKTLPVSPSAFTFFWGGKFSQWYWAPMLVEDIEYSTAEHFMMSEKCRVFGDHKTLIKIQQAGTPHEAKILGRSVTPYNEEVWASLRYDVVLQGNLAKFSQHPRPQRLALEYGR